MIDLIKLTIIAGDGGHGRVAFRREKYIPKGGPNGGNGGDGGHVVLMGSSRVNTLKHLAGVSKINAQNGEIGGGQKRFGKKGESKIIEVPVGTVVWLEAENGVSKKRTAGITRWGSEYIDSEVEKADDKKNPQLIGSLRSKGDVEFEQYYMDPKNSEFPVPSNPDKELKADERRMIAQITQEGQEVVICQGGFGGRGNTCFKSSSNTTPREAEFGTPGERKQVTIELKLLADVGLVGFPNAGKSTLLSKITKARPKIASYPFTTIEPNLGVLSLSDERELVIADIPGLIEGASDGKGLGLDFLRHVENCRVLWVILYLDEPVVFDESLSELDKAELVWKQYQSLLGELKKYSDKVGVDLIHRPMIVSLNKVDIYSAELIDIVINLFKQKKVKLWPFSNVSSVGTKEMIKKLDGLSLGKKK